MAYTILDGDLFAVGSSRKELAARLKLTHQAVSRWAVTNKIPEDRVEEVRKIIGPDAKIFKGQEELPLDLPPRQARRLPAEPGRYSLLTSFADVNVRPAPALHPAEKAFLDALPAELRVYAEPTHVSHALGATRWRVDYASRRVVIEITAAYSNSIGPSLSVMSAKIVQLASLRQALGGDPARRYVLAVVAEPRDEDGAPRTYGNIAAKAALLGVHFVTASSGEELARLVLAWEQAETAIDEEEYEEDEPY